MTKDELIALLDANFNTGLENFITGQKLYNAFISFVDMVFGFSGIGRFRGVCTVITNPGTSVHNDYFICKYDASNEQVFTHFNITVAAGEFAIFKYITNTWVKIDGGLIGVGGGSGGMTALEIKTALETLTGTNRLNKSAVRGADFCLNLRARGDILDSSFRSGSMNGIIKGDFWIYNAAEPPNPGDSEVVALGDWVIAITDQSGPNYYYDFSDSAKWQIVHFGDTQVSLLSGLSHYRISYVGNGVTLTMSGIEADIVSVTINKLTYYGKEDDNDGFGIYDFVWYKSGGNTVITINDELVGFQFQNSMVIDILYK